MQWLRAWGAPLAAVQYLDGMSSHAGLNCLTSQAVWNTVIGRIDFNVIVNIDGAVCEVCQFIALGGQWTQGGAVQALEPCLTSLSEIWCVEVM